jgi:8-oxo-dGTP diphosphatase
MINKEDYLLPRRFEILQIIRDHQQVSFDFIKRRFMAVSDRLLRYDLKKLQDDGFIKKRGVTRGAIYEPGFDKIRETMKRNKTRYPRIGIGVIVIKGKKVLLGKRKGSHGAQTWNFPGGHLDFGETPQECAQREVWEEAGIEIKDLKLGSYTNDIFKKEGKHYITIFVIAQYKSGRVKIKEPEKCEQWRWFTWNNLPQPLFLPIVNLLKQKLVPY